MSKRQQSLLDFITKKSKTDVDSRAETDQAVEACQSLSDLNDIPSNPSCSKSLNENIPTVIYSEECGIESILSTNPQNLDDTEKAKILTNTWKVPENFVYPFSIHKKKGKDVKCYLSKKHFDNFQWLTYSHTRNGLLCKFCVLFAKQGGVYKQTELNKLVKVPLDKFSKLLGKDGDLLTHENSQYHQEAVERANLFLEKINKPELSIENLLDEKRKQKVLENRSRLIPIIEGILLLARQNIPFRSHRDDGFNFESLASDQLADPNANLKSSPVNYGNFKSILQYRAHGDPVLREHLLSSSARSTYISKTVQEEFISIIGQEISDVIIKNINKARFYSIIFDETTDISNKSQMSLFIRYVLEGEIRDDFLCFIDCYNENYESNNLEVLEPILSGKILATTVINALKKYSLKLDDCIGIGTDGCNVMLGEHKGAVTELKKVLKNAVKSPCFNHVLNLSISKTSKVPSVRNCIGTMKEVIAFFNVSPKRFLILKKIGNLKLIKLCETRWVERHQSVFHFCESIESIVKVLDIISNWQDTESSSKAENLKNSILKTEFIVSVYCLSEILSYTVNLSKVLQSTSIDKVSANNMINQVLQTLKEKRINADKDFCQLFNDISKLNETLGTNISKPRIVGRQVHRLNVETTNTVDYYRIATYIPILDHLIEDLEFRFDNDLLNILNLNIVLPTAFSNLSTDEINASIENLILFMRPLFLNEALFEYKLKAELKLWHNKFKDTVPKDSVQSLYSSCNKEFFPYVKIIFQILLTLPVSVASAERSFSVLKKLKTWLRNRMTEDRLCGLALMYMHRDIEIKIKNVLDRFAAKKRRVAEFVL